MTGKIKTVGKDTALLTGKERAVCQVRAAAAAGPCNGPRQTRSAWAGQGPSLSNLHSWRDRDPSKPVAAPLAFSVVLEVLLQLHVTQGATAVSLNALGGLRGHTSRAQPAPSPGPPALHTLPFSWVLVPQVVFQVLEPREPCSPWGLCPRSFKCDRLKWG